MGYNRTRRSYLILIALALPMLPMLPMLPALAQAEQGPVQSVDGEKVGACGVDRLVHIVNGQDVGSQGSPFCCNLTSNLYEPCGYPITARSFGAKGDGTTDDATAIQAAVDAGYSYLGPGTFMVATTIVLGPGEGLIGDGPALTIVKAKSGLVGAVIEDPGVGAHAGMFVRDLKVDCDAGLAVDGIVFWEDTNITITGVWVHDCDRAGIYLKDLTPLAHDGLGEVAFLDNIRITDSLQTAAADWEGALWIQGWERVFATNVDIDGADLALADAGNRVGLLLDGTGWSSVAGFNVQGHETGVAIVLSSTSYGSDYNRLTDGATHDNEAGGWLIEQNISSNRNDFNIIANSSSFSDCQGGLGQYCNFEIGGNQGYFTNLRAKDGGANLCSSNFHFYNATGQHLYIGFVTNLQSGGPIADSPCQSVADHVRPQTGVDRCTRYRHTDSFRAGGTNEGDDANHNLMGVSRDNSGTFQAHGPSPFKFGRNIDEDIELRASYDNGTSENSSRLLIKWDDGDSNVQLPPSTVVQSLCDGTNCKPTAIARQAAEPSFSTFNHLLWVDTSGTGIPPECIHAVVDNSGGTDRWTELVCGADLNDPFD